MNPKENLQKPTPNTTDSISTYTLSNGVHKIILNEFDKKTLVNSEQFIETITQGLRNYFYILKLGQKSSRSTIKKELTQLHKYAETLNKHISKCNPHTFSLINIGYYEALDEQSYPINDFKEMLDDLIESADAALNSDSMKIKPGPDKHNAIHHVTKAVVTALEKYTNYVANSEEDGKLAVILDVIIDDIGYEGSGRSIADNFFKNHSG